jgi:hypothetical protein
MIFAKACYCLPSKLARKLARRMKHRSLRRKRRSQISDGTVTQQLSSSPDRTPFSQNRKTVRAGRVIAFVLSSLRSCIEQLHPINEAW